ncbi:MAG: hypothetical protein KAG43_05300 [Candidatus Marithrix sp.]|nr:hypothetical protein [Candidatus Marithrix sp.]
MFTKINGDGKLPQLVYNAVKSLLSWRDEKIARLNEQGASKRCRKSFAIFIAIALYIPTSYAEFDVRLVKDIVSGSSGSSPHNFAVFNNKLYFQAKDDNGKELWVYDGTNDPSMVKDINASGDSEPKDLTVFNNKLYFQANNGTNGLEMWVYDGTNDPSMVKDIRSGSGYAFITNAYFTEFNNKLYFGANDGINGNELWVYDGTNDPSMVAGMNTNGVAGGWPQYLTVFNNKLYFQGGDGGDTISELWVYDGTNNPTVINIEVGDRSTPRSLTVFNNKLYFEAHVGTDGSELWVYDGTNNPSMVKDISSGINSFPQELTVFNNKLYFSADDSTNGTELWVYDGTNDPSMVKDIYTGSSNSSHPRDLTVFNNKLYFRCSDGTDNNKLWVYDGTNDPSAVEIETVSVSDLIVFNNALYFQANNFTTNNGAELWVYKDLLSNPITFSNPGGKTYGDASFTLAATATSSSLSVIYSSSTTSVCTVNSNEVAIVSAGDCTITASQAGNATYAAATDVPQTFTIAKKDITATAENKTRIYGVNNPAFTATYIGLVNSVAPSTPPTLSTTATSTTPVGNATISCTPEIDTNYNVTTCNSGTLTITEPPPPPPDTGMRVRQITNNIGDGNWPAPAILGAMNNKMYLSATDTTYGSELWEFDVNSEQIQQVHDINPGIDDSGPQFATVWDSVLYFRGSDGTEQKFWGYNGTDLTSISINGETDEVVEGKGIVFNNKLYLLGGRKITDHKWELFVYDGTNEPTLVYDGTPSSHARPSNFIVFDNKLFYDASDENADRELWQYDGINDPTRVYDINSVGKSNPRYLVVFDNKLYFQATDGTNGTELWQYDGTNTPIMIHNINNGGDSSPSDLTVFNNKLYFSANDGTNGKELWQYDGSNTPTMVHDINNGGNSSPYYLTVFNNKLYFSAKDDTNGTELWQYDGSNTPTMVHDIYDSSSYPYGNSYPYDLTVFNNVLYFIADDGTGDKLWVLEEEPEPAVIITQSSSSTSVEEGGSTDTFDVVLSAEPTNDVTVTLSLDSQTTVDNSTPTFTTTNWNTAQTVTVTAVDDSDYEGNHNGTIGLSSSSNDSDYEGATFVVDDTVATNLSVSITDNDSPPPPTDTSSSTSGSTSTPLPETMTVFAEFAGYGSGTISSIPRGINCKTVDEECSAKFDTVSRVKLTAKADAGSEFDRWSGKDCDKEMFLVSSRTCTAYFKLTPRTLTVSYPENGLISSYPQGIYCGDTSQKCSYEFDGSAKINLTATPNPDYMIDSWSENCPEGKVQLLENTKCSATFKVKPAEPIVLTPVEPIVPDVIPPVTNPIVPTTPNDEQSIVDVDEPTISTNTVSFSEISYEVAENAGQIEITATRTGTEGKIAVELHSSEDNRHKQLVETLVWDNGIEGDVSVPITIIDNDIVDGNQEVILSLGAGENTSLIEPDTSILTIIDDDIVIDVPVIDTPVKELVNPSTTLPIIHDCNTSGTLNEGCDANGKTITDLKIEEDGELVNGVIDAPLENNGRLSNLTVTKKGSTTGGRITGYVKNLGLMTNFEFVGGDFSGADEDDEVVGTIAGLILNNSEIGGSFVDVYLAPNTHITGGILERQIIGDSEQPAVLERLHIKTKSRVSNVIVEESVTYDDGVTFINTTFKTKVVKKVILKGRINGTRFKETYTKVESVTISSQSVISNIVIGDYVKFEEGVILGENVSFAIHEKYMQTHSITSLPAFGKAIIMKGKTTSTSFARLTGGASENGDNFKRKRTIKRRSQVTIKSNLLVDVRHIGKQADLLVVAIHEGKFYMLNANGKPISWNGNLDDLIAFQRTRLSTVQQLEIWNEPLDIDGSVKVYVGYRLDSEIVYSPEDVIEMDFTE